MPKKPKTARAVFPNAGVEAWYRTELQRLVREMSQDMLDRVRRAWRDAGLAQDAKSRPTPAILLGRALEKWGGLWTHRLDEASTKIARNFANKTTRATDAAVMDQLRNAGFTVRFKPTKAARAAFDAVVAENVGLIRSIPQRYLGDVQNAIWQSVMQGSDLATLSNTIHEKYGIAHRRAALIARDQNHKAKAAMERARRKEVGVTKAIWQHSHAGKDPRPTHVAMDGKEYDIEQGMWDSAVQKYIWPGTEINCRCTDRPVIPGFE